MKRSTREPEARGSAEETQMAPLESTQNRPRINPESTQNLWGSPQGVPPGDPPRGSPQRIPPGGHAPRGSPQDGFLEEAGGPSQTPSSRGGCAPRTPP